MDFQQVKKIMELKDNIESLANDAGLSVKFFNLLDDCINIKLTEAPKHRQSKARPDKKDERHPQLVYGIKTGGYFAIDIDKSMEKNNIKSPSEITNENWPRGSWQHALKRAMGANKEWISSYYSRVREGVTQLQAKHGS